MPKGQINILVVITLLIFVGQALAISSLSCTMLPGINISSEMSMQNQSNAHHQMSNMNSSMSGMNHDMSSMTSSQDDCCSDDTQCNMSGCISFAIADDIFLKATYFSFKTVYFDIKLSPNRISSSLYRPPITF